MTLAFYIAAAVVAFAVAALVLAPLRKAAPRLFSATLAAIPVLAFALYQVVGTPAALNPAAVAAATPAGPQSMDEAIGQLEAVLQKDPAQPEGWALLARSYATRGERIKARDAFARALKLVPDDPGLLVETAQARAQANSGNLFDDEALEMLRKAVAIDPANQRAVWFIGVVQRQRGQDAEAVATWEALLPKVDADTATALRTQIDEARSAAGMPPLPAADSQAAPTPDAAPGLADAGANAVTVELEIDPKLRERFPNATLFVIARQAGGPPMPVAVERHPLATAPASIVLGDDDGPMPTMKLSALREVEILARISQDGTAMRSDDDIDSAPQRVTLPAREPISLTLDNH